MADLSDKEKDLISKLREKTKDLNLTATQNDERILIRWIRGRDHDLVKAEEMLRNSMEWRRINDIDNIRSWKAPEHVSREYPIKVLGLDKEGYPVITLPLGTWDVKKIVAAGHREAYIRYVDQFFDGVNSKPQPNGRSQIVVILDMEGYSFRQLTARGTVDTIMETLRRFDLNYPEVLKYAVILNASKVFTILFSMVKPILAEKTLSKVNMFGYNESKWKAFLHARIPLETLPLKFGGTNEEAEKILYGNPTLPAQDTADNNNAEIETLVALSVGAGAQVKMELVVPEPNSAIKWRFRTEAYDIGFGVYDEKGKEVYPYQKYDSHVKVQEGSLPCDRIGKYTICFDNTYSRLRGKSLHYMASVITPSGQENMDGEVMS